jgi:cell division protein FtsI/penicillin-binding protein 2
MIEILQHSNNCGAAWVAEQLGAKTLRDYFLKFGLDEPLGIDLEDEDTGIVKELPDWRPIDLANAAFGQGVSVTPLQLVSIFSTIVNQGVMMKPYLVSEIREGEKIIEIKPKETVRVLSAKSAEIMKEMLTAAVEGGESKFYNLTTHRVAGKTGTAQIPVGGKYDPTKTNATFVGFLPSHPNFVMLVLLRQPSASIYAAETAVPVWVEIAKELTVYYGVEPDK